MRKNREPVPAEVSTLIKQIVDCHQYNSINQPSIFFGDKYERLFELVGKRLGERLLIALHDIYD